MKIARIESFVIRVPYKHGGPYPVIGGKAWDTMDSLLVRVQTDDGIVGWGESFGYNAIASTKAALDAIVAPLFVGQDLGKVQAGNIAELNFQAQQKLQNFGRTGAMIFALSGVDIALWDIAGQVAGQPLYKMLGAKNTVERAPVYASLLRYGDAKLVADNCARAVQRGYRMIKLHEIEEPMVAAARRAIGPDVALTVDTNCPHRFDGALAMAKSFAAHDLLWLEEPLWPPEDWAGLARIGKDSAIAIAAGENASTLADFHHMLAAGAVTYAQPSVTKIGGLTGFLDVLTLAKSKNVKVAPHSPYFGPGLIASIHIVAAQGDPMMVERFYCDLEASPMGDAIVAQGGFMAVPQAPGLGITMDESVIARYRIG
ncbi:MAG: mandelate racemase/muconate lactonizing enzyme family protein [Rhodospirillales bacterium]